MFHWQPLQRVYSVHQMPGNMEAREREKYWETKKRQKQDAWPVISLHQFSFMISLKILFQSFPQMGYICWWLEVLTNATIGHLHESANACLIGCVSVCASKVQSVFKFTSSGLCCDNHGVLYVISFNVFRWFLACCCTNRVYGKGIWLTTSCLLRPLLSSHYVLMTWISLPCIGLL